MQIPFVDLKSQYASIEKEIQDTISEVLNRGDYILGQSVSDFEKAFSEACSVPYTVGCSNGTDALILALKACGVSTGDEVITVANTWVSTVFAISTVGASPVFADILKDTHLMDPESVKSRITPRTKAILPVHLYGQVCDMTSIMKLADEYNLIVVEDACQAHLAEWQEKKAGSFGHAAAFSFYPGKNLGAYGDAGCVTTSSSDIEKKIRLLRNMGQEKKHHHEVIGLNMRLDSLQAAILNVKLKHLPLWTEKRRQAAGMYRNLLGSSEVRAFSEHEHSNAAYHLFVVEHHKRDDLTEYLNQNGVSAQIHYPTPVHLQPCYKGLAKSDLPVTEDVTSRILSLPIFPEITEEQQKFVVDSIKSFKS